jgi:hypothetical protein
MVKRYKIGTKYNTRQVTEVTFEDMAPEGAEAI